MRARHERHFNTHTFDSLFSTDLTLNQACIFCNATCNTQTGSIEYRVSNTSLKIQANTSHSAGSMETLGQPQTVEVIIYKK